MQTSSPFNPVSPGAHDISTLFIVTLIVAAVIFSLVAGLVLFAAYRYRQREGEGEPPQVYGHRGLEITWTVIPGLILIFLFILTLITMHKSDPGASPGTKVDLVIIAHQWWWELHYPKAGVVSANEIHIPVGRRLYTLIESADVIHSFWVPQLGRKMDAIPGHPNHIWLESDIPGLFLGTCSEYCGAEHAWMRIRVIAQPEIEFDAWIADQRRLPVFLTEGEAAAGLKVFKEQTCINCHTIAGASTNVSIGPDLTHLASRQTLGTGVLDNTPAGLTKWLQNPQAVKPGINMPFMKLSDQQIKELVAFLETLK
jgi:cytochrome c oxidase subunit 2